MNLEYTAADNAFRQEVRRFLDEHLPRDMAARTYAGFTPPAKQDLNDWNKILFQKGWAAPHWPVEYGEIGRAHV